MARTDNEDDLAYLNNLIETTKSYTRHNLTDGSGRAGKISYGTAWDVVEEGTMYIKIDDDIVGLFSMLRIVQRNSM